MGITARGICAGYGGALIVEGIDIEAKPGELVGVLGPNAAGKTTLLRALAGALPLTSGEVLLEGASIAQLAPRQRARMLALVPQAQPLEWAFTVRELVEMGRTPYVSGFGRLRLQDHEAVDGAIERLGLQALAQRDATSLSAGQAQLVMIARALAQAPQVLLLDEPTAHLDLTHQLEVMEAVRVLVRDRNLASIAVMHDLNLAARYCDRLLLMARGKPRAFGTPATVITRPLIQSVFGVEVVVRRHPATGATFVVPLSVSPVTGEGEAERGPARRLHVICGGGSGAALMGALVRSGFDVSAGVVHVLDSDFEAAEALGVRLVAEAPFSQITKTSVEEAQRLALQADAVVLAACPIGPGNESNLDIAEAVVGAGRKLFIVAVPPIEQRDYTKGRATARVQGLVTQGAVAVSGVDAVVSALAQDQAPTSRPTRLMDESASPQT